MAETGEHRTSLPSWWDVAVAGLVLVTCLLPFMVAQRSMMLALDPARLLVGATVAGSAALVVRRRLPWTVWLTTTAIGLAAVAIGGGPTPAYLPSVVALYTVSVRTTRARAVAAALVSVAGPVGVVLILSRHNAFDSVAFGMTAWSGLALMSGIAVRTQRAAVRAAQERARLAEATREEEAQRRVTEERLRIARELHDVVAHHVSVINVQAGVAGYLVRTDPDGAAAALAHVREASQTVLGEVSAVLGLLRSSDEPETAPAPGLRELDALVERVRRSGAQVVLQAAGPERELPPLADLTAYRVLQEALTNAARHGTGTVVASLELADDSLVVEVRNPCSAAVSSAPGGGHGLVGMRERVVAVGGTLEAGRDGAGWLVRAVLPVASAVSSSGGVTREPAR